VARPDRKLLMREIVQSVRNDAGDEPQSDDSTLLVLKYRGAS
jgi:serine phosphatase RsbU (regulator of sigma subunit)